jgi:hypothetical protein
VDQEFVESFKLNILVKVMFGRLANFTDEDVDEYSNYIRMLWRWDRDDQNQQTKRLELIGVLRNQLREIIEKEKLKLKSQLALLDSLAVQVPFGTKHQDTDSPSVF